MKGKAKLLAASVLASGLALAGLAPADAPAGHFTVSAGVVYDAKTQLKWQQVPMDGQSWKQASDYCKALRLQGSGWRLPSRNELLTLVDYSRRAPAIDPVAFPSTNAGLFWTQTPSRAQSDHAWAINFTDGSTALISKETAHWTRCVR